ncbi:nucleoplasmin-2 isoform X3 [Nycticebus coucang]|uniref:nucleoplasmin-2 isoform X3 n=1 Tax=Nycticebus coucang TaxID=9470 RepID=UPI00234C54F2|nr:nucleoplasmin-2 isoform X3 [Nycticebus coucang]
MVRSESGCSLRERCPEGGRNWGLRTVCLVEVRVHAHSGLTSSTCSASRSSSPPGAMNLSSTSSTGEKTVTTALWGEWGPSLLPRAPQQLGALESRCPGERTRQGMDSLGRWGACPLPSLSPRAGCELSQEKRTWTFKPQQEGKRDSKLLLHTICLGEKAKEELNRVEILPAGNPEDKKMPPVTIASLQASVLPMVTMMKLELSPPVTFHLRAGSGPVFLTGQECYDVTWDEEEEEEEEAEEEEEEEEEEDEDAEISVDEDIPVKQIKRPGSQKQASAAKIQC